MANYLKLFENQSDYELVKGELDLPNVSYIQDSGEVCYNPDIFNGHEYVDLGLPSGLLWATCNVGANVPEEAGLYFSWAETVGYTAEQIGVDEYFYGNSHKYMDSECNWTKYNSEDGLTTLELKDDAAYINMGGNWRMPTKDQISELIENTVSTQTTINEVVGRLFTATNGNTLFIPAAGFGNYGNHLKNGVEGYYRSNTTCQELFAWGLLFSQDESVEVTGLSRYQGYPVRGVISR